VSRVVCIGWGSLIWDPRTLPMLGRWNDDGPHLPVEFARQADDGRLTLVLLQGAPTVRALWTELDVATLGEAVTALAMRERCAERFVGQWPGGAGGETHDIVGAWASEKGAIGAVWTALPARWDGEIGRVSSLAERIAYLRCLAPPTRARAREYIERAPAPVTTPTRSLIEEELGWRG
jgi:hypothetical protein